jgi:very-short-patch-repair endonuclease
VFEDKKLIVELDGNQHLKSIEADKIRDSYLSSLGYNVLRISHDEFKKRHFSGKGFSDLMGC